MLSLTIAWLEQLKLTDSTNLAALQSFLGELSETDICRAPAGEKLYYNGVWLQEIETLARQYQGLEIIKSIEGKGRATISFYRTIAKFLRCYSRLVH